MPPVAAERHGPHRRPWARRAEERARANVRTFAEVATLYIESHGAGWRNPKHRAQWAATLDTYAAPVFGTARVSEVDTDAVLRALEPIWRAKPETASRLRGRVQAVLDYATAQGWRRGENPARWRGHLSNLLPAPRDWPRWNTIPPCRARSCPGSWRTWRSGKGWHPQHCASSS